MMRLALVYSDGSVTVLAPETTLEHAIAYRADCDDDTGRPEHRTRVAYVTLKIVATAEAGFESDLATIEGLNGGASHAG